MSNRSDKPAAEPLGRIAPKRTSGADSVVERRAAPRAQVDLPVTIKVTTIDAAVSSKVLNISRYGLFIATTHPPAIGAVLDVEIQLPNGRLLLHARVEVVRHQLDANPPGIGARFLEISYEAQELIDRLVGVDHKP